jgi:hypothetical protein
MVPAGIETKVALREAENGCTHFGIALKNTMANLLICSNCNKTWSMTFDLLSAPLMLKYAWCPACRTRNLVPIGNVPGVNKPPAYFGVAPPPAPAQPAPLMLTYAPEPTPQVAPVTQPTPVAARRRQPGVNILPSSTTPIILGASPQMVDVTFRNHIQGQPISMPPDPLLQKYFSSTADKLLLQSAEYYSATPSKAYARFIAIYMIERGANTAILVNKPKGEAWSGTGALKRDLKAVLARIAAGDSIAKNLKNAAYNNDGTMSSDKAHYDRYGKGYQGNRVGSKYLPQPSLVTGLPGKYWEFYVDRDSSKGSTPLTIGGGRPGVERIFIQVPDYIFYTWNHYGSDVRNPREKSGLADTDIWAVYSFTANAWQFGLTRT